MSFWGTDEDTSYYDNMGSESHDEYDDDDFDSQNIEEEIVCLRAEYAFEMSKNSQLQNELQKINVRMRRRQAIIEYYDDYVFNYIFDDSVDKLDIKKLENGMDIMNIDKDYENVIRNIEIEERERLEQEDAERRYRQLKHQSSMTVSLNSVMTSQIFSAASGTTNSGRRARAHSASAAHFMYASANILYQVSKEDQMIEKKWMKRLRKKKMKIFINNHRKQRLKNIKKECGKKLQELEQQIYIKQRIQQLNDAKKKLEILQKSRITFTQNVSKELDQLRNVIHSLHCTLKSRLQLNIAL